MDRQDSLAITSKELMLAQPFYGLFLIGLNKDWSKDLPTAGVCKENINYKLTINPDFWDSLNVDHRKGLLWHEILHIAFDHLMMRSSYGDFQLFNIAADCELNQYIPKEFLPDGAILPESFPELQLEKKAGTDYYYRMLSENRESDSVEELLDGLGGKDMHESWKEFEKLSDAEKRLIKAQAEYQIREAVEEIIKSKGHLPGEIKSIFDRITNPEPAKFDWRKYIRNFIGNSYQVETKSSRKKLNKRFPDFPAMKFKPKKHILVAIDTSGSVSDNEVKEFINEIYHLHRAGTELTIAQCDTEIRSVKKYKPKAPIEIHGRGGTEFDPVLEYYNKNTHIYTSLVYLTDGECNASIKPRGKMLWVISTNGTPNTELPGPQIQLN
jgi:predicted metal-dependent peptidase